LSKIRVAVNKTVRNLRRRIGSNFARWRQAVPRAGLTRDSGW
jgi:hypothetical protein